ncbi:MAG: hypothetical protein HOO88_08635 [Kiritimatiellaceae bacterium]|nr:hypothetical protein [Kiritimatiellaceae bacterium]
MATTGNDTTGTGTISLPFATLERARQKVATVNKTMTGNIIVYVRGGTYYQTNTVNFTTNDSGSQINRCVIYQAYTNEIPVISGGTRITGWTDSDGDGIYTVNVGTNRFRQLYVNGRRAIRARTPEIGNFARIVSWDNAASHITVNTSDITGINTAGAAEMVIARYWNQNRLRVTNCTVNGSTADLEFKNPESTIAFANLPPAQQPDQIYYLENSLSFLNSEDEWFLGPNGILYYKPVTGESIASSVIIAPKIDTLINLQGASLSAPIHHIQFIGLTFAHTTWNTPDNEGYIGLQAGFCHTNALQNVKVANMKSGVVADKADSLLFENNTFAHMGGQALTLYSACHSNTIRGNLVYDISGNGISVDMAVVLNPADSRTTCSDNNIWNNYLSDCAVDYWGSVGIFGGYVKNTAVAFNEVAYMPYTGISIGWGWMADANPAMTNSIQYNHIHHVMNLLHDGGGIYTLSKQPGTLIMNNYIHDIRRSRWTEDTGGALAAIYLDNGSSGITVSNNVILPVEHRVFNHTVHIEQTNYISNNDSLRSGVVDNAGPQTNYLPSIISPELIGYWKMETNTGVLADSSGYRNNGTMVGTTATKAAGLCGNAVHFDGSAYVTVPSSPTLTNLQQFTICAWIKPDMVLSNLSTYPSLVHKQSATGGYLLGCLYTNDNRIGMRFRSTATQQTTYYENSSTNWIHVAGIYDGTHLRIYRNGVLESEVVTSAAITHDTTALKLGYNFKGWMDEVRIYNEALTGSDLQTLVDMKMDTSLIARWPMDNGHPTLLSDVSGNRSFGVIDPSATDWFTDSDNQYHLEFQGGAANTVIVADDPYIQEFYPLSNPHPLQVTNYTISAWIMPYTNFASMVCGTPILVSKQDFPTTNGYHLGVLGADTDDLGNRILTGSGVKQTTYPETSTGGSWIHVAGTYNGNVLIIYKNGVEQSRLTTTGLIQHNAHDLLIGYGFEGIMRDVRIYNRALSATEIQILGP